LRIKIAQGRQVAQRILLLAWGFVCLRFALPLLAVLSSLPSCCALAWRVLLILRLIVLAVLLPGLLIVLSALLLDHWDNLLVWRLLGFLSWPETPLGQFIGR
jgi:hypothetical protein